MRKKYLICLQELAVTCLWFIVCITRALSSINIDHSNIHLIKNVDSAIKDCMYMYDLRDDPRLLMTQIKPRTDFKRQVCRRFHKAYGPHED